MANEFSEGLIGFGLGLDEPFHQTFEVGLLWRGFVEVDIIGEYGNRNTEGLNGLRNDGEIEDLGLCMKN